MDTQLNGRTALVTGASQGIGEAIARALHAEGAKVAFLARSEAKLAAITDALGERALAVGADVTNEDSLAQALATIEAKLGPIDILVNNAGIFTKLETIIGQTQADYDLTMNVNARGVWFGCKFIQNYSTQ